MSDALISGQIDLLKKMDDDGKVTAVEIIDFKTNKNDSIYQGDYDKQLRFYAIACLESLGLKPQKACVHHLDDDKKEFVDISPSKLEEVKGQITDDIVSIMSTNRQFIAKPDKKVCKECDYKVICPYKETTKVKFTSFRR